MKHIVAKIGLILTLSSFAYAVDMEFSGFGTLGGAISNKDYTYLRYIDNDGTFNKDSLVGVQTDIIFTPQLSATVQGKFAPSKENDSKWDPSLTWAFLSYRPTNDWLIRVGKVRIPLYLNSQNMDVGVTYDAIRLPNEVYSLSPEDNALGIIVTKSFELESGELSADAFYGKVNTPYRVYLRDDMSAYSTLGGRPQGANFSDLKLDLMGLALLYETDEGNRFRVGLYKSILDNNYGGNFALQPSITPPLSLFYPLPYYQPVLPFNKTDIIAFTLGMDYRCDEGYRITSEYAMRKMLDADTGPNSQSAYVTLSKNIEKWTPYITLSGTKTSNNVKNLYAALNADPVNNILPANRQFADYIIGSEQKSVALGISYSLSPTQKLKAEWARSHIGSMSNFLIDTPSIEPITHETINVFSLSYSMSF